MRGTTMALGVLRFTEPPAAARARWLPGLHPSADTGIEDYVMWALPGTREHPGPPEDLPPALRPVVAGAWPDHTVTLRLGVIPPPPAWPPGPVTVLGDAIHLAPGFGGNLAMRDAHLLRGHWPTCTAAAATWSRRSARTRTPCAARR